MIISWVLFMVIAHIGSIIMKTNTSCARTYLIICNITTEIDHCCVWKSSWIFVLLESSWRLIYNRFMFLNILPQLSAENKLFVLRQIMERIVRAGDCPVVVAQWSEHWALKSGTPGFNSWQLPAFHFLLLCLKANKLMYEYLIGVYVPHP